MKHLYAFLAFLLSATFLSGQVMVTDNNGAGTGTTTWTKDKVYVLTERVYVNQGDVLTIEAGTVIQGVSQTMSNPEPGALIVSRGAKIIAQGTRAEPIIFTAENDDLIDPTDIPLFGSGFWGGVIILGNAGLNSSPGQTGIEGIPAGDTRSQYGAIDTDNDSIFDSFNDLDSSGVFSYVSIRYGGDEIGIGNEINGLTLGGVGSKTVINNVEVLFNADDGIEFFGGTVNTSHMIAAFCKDDAFDYDEGFRGKGQFWAVFQKDGFGDRGGEHDGGTSPETGTPLATPEIYNATFIGGGESAGKRAITFRDNAGGTYKNSIFTEYGRGIDIELLGNGGDHSYIRQQNGDLALENNIFWNVAGNDATKGFTITAGKFGTKDANGNTIPAAVTDSTNQLNAATTAIQTYFAATNNVMADPGIADTSRQNIFQMDPRPSGSGPAMQNLAVYPTDDFFQTVPYKGAFSPAAGEFWPGIWTGLWNLGFLARPLVGSLADQFELIATLNVFPSPNAGTFTIAADELEANEPVKIQVLDMMGKVVYSRNEIVVAGSLHQEISLSVPAAIYTVKVQQGIKLGTQRIVIK